MPPPEFIAAPDTLPGLLQRGRGEGYRRVLRAPRAEAHGLLIQCITHDPRLDSQVESRDDYYASIALDVDLPLDPLAEHLRQNDDPSQGGRATLLTVTTLTELAKRNYRNATEILCDYIAWGQWWNWPLHDLLSIPDADLSPRLAQAIERHFPSTEALDEEMLNWPAEEFIKLSPFSSRIAASVSKVPIRTEKNNLPDLSSLTIRKLLVLADRENYHPLGKALAGTVKPADLDLLISSVSLQNPFSSHVALAGIATLAPPSLAHWLAELWLGIPEKNAADPARNLARVIFRQGISRAILALPAEATLPIARDWMTQAQSPKQELAEKLLQEHATIDDLPFLRESLRPMLVDEDAEYNCFMIKAFHNIPNAGIVPELVDIFHQFRFSKGRAYAAKALQVTSPEFFAANLASECLWDCEDDSRELGMKFAPLEFPDVLHRIQNLAGNSLEDELVRNEAKARLCRAQPVITNIRESSDDRRDNLLPSAGPTARRRRGT